MKEGRSKSKKKDKKYVETTIIIDYLQGDNETSCATIGMIKYVDGLEYVNGLKYVLEVLDLTILWKGFSQKVLHFEKLRVVQHTIQIPIILHIST